MDPAESNHIIPDRFFIRPEDIRDIEGCSIVTARRQIKLLKDTLGKTKISFLDYCEDRKVPLEDVLKRVGVSYSVK